jgi:hypothetical protein
MRFMGKLRMMAIGPLSVLKRFAVAATAAVVISLATPVQAHVKWFAPYIVDAPPAPVISTLSNVWFWLAIVLVMAFFLVTRVVETSRAGETILLGMDRVARPLWTRLDDFVRVVIGAFFVAIFAVGGIYLTPDLKTPANNAPLGGRHYPTLGAGTD